MLVIADTTKLVEDAVLTPDQANILKARGRAALVDLAVGTLLCFGIVASTFGLIFWLAEPIPVAMIGAVALVAGLAVVVRGGVLYRMFGTAGALIGAGLLSGGAAVELLANHQDIAGPVLLAAGLAVAALAARGLVWRALTTSFIAGAILLMGVALHLVGGATLLEQHEISGLPLALAHGHAAAVLAVAGMLVNVRAVTALAIAPFAGMLSTGTAYGFASYVFFSPESTLTILQMAALVIVCVLAAPRLPDRVGRHLTILASLGFVVANLSALVGSIFGDVVGESLWGPSPAAVAGADGMVDWDAHQAALDAFRAGALSISEHAYSALWALALAALVAWSAHTHRRGLFNAAVTFAALHAYTQAFESFADQPLAYVVGGLAAIPLAWGMWWLDGWFTSRGLPPT